MSAYEKFVETLKQTGRAIRAMNLPNKLTLLRVAMVPLYLLLLWAFNDDKTMCIWPLLVFVAASLTDMLDGRIARSRNLITNSGKFMDPIADKLLTHTAFIMLTAIGRLNVAACIIFIAREFVVSGLRLCAVEQGHVDRGGHERQDQDRAANDAGGRLTITGEGLLPALLTIAASVMTLYRWANTSGRTARFWEARSDRGDCGHRHGAADGADCGQRRADARANCRASASRCTTIRWWATTRSGCARRWRWRFQKRFGHHDGRPGPTQDDLSKEIAAELLGLPMEFDPESWDAIGRYFRKKSGVSAR